MRISGQRKIVLCAGAALLAALSACDRTAATDTAAADGASAARSASGSGAMTGAGAEGPAAGIGVPAGGVAAYTIPVVQNGAPVASDCDRACLEGWVDRYMDGLIAGDPAAAGVAANARYTENGQLLSVGNGIWRSTMGKGTYRLFVTDVPAQQVAVMTTFTEDTNDPNAGAGGALALRLKIRDGAITEIEQMVIRNQSLYDRLEEYGRPRDAYFEDVPEANRMSRADLIEVANKYFTGMSRNDGLGDYPFADDCDRFENGSLTTNQPTPEGQTRPDPATSTGYSAQWSCREQFESGLLHFVTTIRDRRFVAVDEERGLVWAFGAFDHQAGETRNFTLPDGRAVTAGPTRPWTWYIAEVFKVEDGLMHEIDAYLMEPPYGMLSGWSTWEDGMSERARNETGVE